MCRSSAALCTVCITSFSSSGGLTDSRAPCLCVGNFLRLRGRCAYNSACARYVETERKSSRWYCACVELVCPHSSPVKYTLKAVRTRLCARWNGTRKAKYTRAFTDALEQLRPCTHTSATTSNFYVEIFTKHFVCSLEPYLPSRY